MHPDLIDEAIWFDDKSKYAYGVESLKREIKRTKDWLEAIEAAPKRMHPDAKRQFNFELRGRRSVEELERQLAVLQGEGEDAYREQLTNRAALFAKELGSITNQGRFSISS